MPIKCHAQTRFVLRSASGFPTLLADIVTLPPASDVSGRLPPRNELVLAGSSRVALCYRERQNLDTFRCSPIRCKGSERSGMDSAACCSRNRTAASTESVGTPRYRARTFARIAEDAVLSVVTQRSWKNAEGEWVSKVQWHRIAIIWNLSPRQPLA